MPIRFRSQAVLMLVGLLFACPVLAAGNKRAQPSQEYLDAKARRDHAAAERNEASADVNRYRNALGPAQNAFNSASRVFDDAKREESALIQRLREENERDPRRAMIRKELTEAQDAERRRRNELLREVHASKAYEDRKAEVKKLEADLAALQSEPLRDVEKIAELSKRLMHAKGAEDEFITEQLRKDAEYRRLDDEHTAAKARFNELEKEIAATIEGNDARRSATQKAGAAMSQRDSARLKVDQIRGQLNSAESRFNRADNAVRDAEAEMSRLAPKKKK